MLNYIILSDESSSSSITNEFQIDDIKWLSPKVEKPSITHTAITSLVKGQSLQLKANISVNNYIPTVYLHYKLNSSAWSKVEMPVTLVSPNLYSAVYNLSSDYFNQVTDKANSFSYCIEVVDSTNESLAYWNDKNESTPQQFNIQLVDTPKEEIIGSNGATLIKTDNATNIDLVTLIVPQGALNTNTSITITKKNITDIAQLDSRNATVAYQFSPALNFNKPVTLVLSYPNTANDGLVDNLEEGYNDATKLRVYYLNEQNDNKWDLVGGLVNTSNKTITFQTNHFSTYAVFYTDLNKESYKPKYRIFTPNGDGVNDKVIFPNLDDVNVEIKILDVNAKKVRDIKQRPYEWDGKDNFGNIVESGTYIYQFKIKIKDKDEYINGTLALAK
jgi:gliding motility-associated-like protein